MVVFHVVAAAQEHDVFTAAVPAEGTVTFERRIGPGGVAGQTWRKTGDDGLFGGDGEVRNP